MIIRTYNIMIYSLNYTNQITYVTTSLAVYMPHTLHIMRKVKINR